jgi:hypothetical protein
MERKIYCFWTGTNKMSHDRQHCLDQLRKTSGCQVVLVTPENLQQYILPDQPLHPAYEFLSFTHRADYLRTYFMNFYGGGYSDIKQTTGDWNQSFDNLINSDKWINGYKEFSNGVAYEPASHFYYELVGNCSYICKPHTPLTMEWYREMINVLDHKLEKLRSFPATSPQDCAEISNGKYPIEWNEMLGRIFHKVCYKYKDKLMNNLPICVFHSYR